MKPSTLRSVLVAVFVFIGVFGIGFAVSSMLTPLPVPAAGGTCGPSTGSESPLEALVKPGSIGAGPEPPASNSAARTYWHAFVDECQTAADQRGLVSLAVFGVSAGIAALGLALVLRRPREHGGPVPGGSGPVAVDHFSGTAPPGVVI